MADWHREDGLAPLLMSLLNPLLSRSSPAVSDQGGGNSEVVSLVQPLRHDGSIQDVFLLELQVYKVEEVTLSHQGLLRV